MSGQSSSSTFWPSGVPNACCGSIGIEHGFGRRLDGARDLHALLSWPTIEAV
jgi:hypothetical protein